MSLISSSCRQYKGTPQHWALLMWNGLPRADYDFFLWDAGNVIGQEFLDRFGVDFGGLDYDFFLLFDRNATWTQRPPRPVSSGATVIGKSEPLADSAASLLR
jgi:hypothetical protein